MAGRRRGRGGRTCRDPATPTSSGRRSTDIADVRNVLERASARETAARVAAGALAKEFLRALGVERPSATCCGSPRCAAPERAELAAGGLRRRRRVAGALPRRRRGRAMVEEINRLRKANESLGGVFEVRAFGLVPGLGSHVAWEERLDGRLAQAMRLDPGGQGRLGRRGLGGRRRCPARSPTTRSSGREERGYLPRDQPRRRGRGRDDERRAAGRPRRA